MQHRAFGTQGFLDRGDRQHHRLVAQLDQHPLDHRQRQRKRDREGRALTLGRLDHHAAAQTHDLSAHHVQADTAPGQGRDLVLGGEPGKEQQLVDLGGRQIGAGGDQAAILRDLADLGAVDAAAIVRHLDLDTTGPVGGRQRDRAFLRLAAALAGHAVLQPVIDRVADHVGQRLDQAFDHGLVDLGLLTDGDHADGFAGGIGRLAQDAMHALEHQLQRLRADGHHAFLNVAGQLADRVQTGDDVGLFVQPRGLDHLGQHRFLDDQFPDHVHQAIDPVQRHADGGRRLGVVGLLNHARRCGTGGLADHLGHGGDVRKHGDGFGGGRGQVVDGQRTNRQRAAILDELEHRHHVGLCRRTGQSDLPGQPGLLRRPVLQQGDRIAIQMDIRLAQLAQGVQQSQRIVARAVQLERGRHLDQQAGSRRGDRIEGQRRVEIQRDRRELERGFFGGVGVDQGGQFGHQPLDLGLVGFPTGPRRSHQIRQAVRTAVQKRHDLRRHVQPVRPDQVQHRLEPVGKGYQRGQAEGGSAPLDRMHRAEHGMHRFNVKAGLFDLAQAGGQHLQQLVALDEEHVAEFIHVGHRQRPRTLSMTAIRRSSSKGFTIHPVAPALRARALRSAPLSVVRTRMGTSA